LLLPLIHTTNVTPALNGRPFRDGGPATLREAVERGDPTIKTVTFTAKRVGAYDVLCVDSGMDGAGTCGWGHKWMVAKGAFIVRPPLTGLVLSFVPIGAILSARLAAWR